MGGRHFGVQMPEENRPEHYSALGQAESVLCDLLRLKFTVILETKKVFVSKKSQQQNNIEMNPKKPQNKFAL